MQINEKIRALREDNDITQDQLAKIAGVSTKQVRRWEQGDSEMGIQKLKLICEYFKVSADYILGLAPDLDWPREERGKKRYTGGCTKYIFLYVKIYSNFLRQKSRPFGLLLSLLHTPLGDLPKIVIETRAVYHTPPVVQIQLRRYLPVKHSCALDRKGQDERCAPLRSCVCCAFSQA